MNITELYAKGEYQKLIDTLSMEEKLNNPHLRLLVSKSYRHLGNMNNALVEGEALRKAYVDYQPVWYHLGVLSMEQDQFQEAVGFFDQAYQLDHTDVLSIYGLGRAYKAVHEYDLANNYYTLALESSHALDVLYSQAKVYSLLGELDKAEKILHILLLYKKDDPIYQQLEKNIALVRDGTLEHITHRGQED